MAKSHCKNTPISNVLTVRFQFQFQWISYKIIWHIGKEGSRYENNFGYLVYFLKQGFYALKLSAAEFLGFLNVVCVCQINFENNMKRLLP